MDEVKIAVAGPLVNVVLVPIFFRIGIALGADPLTIGSPVGGFGSVGRFFILVLIAVFTFFGARTESVGYSRGSANNSVMFADKWEWQPETSSYQPEI